MVSCMICMVFEKSPNFCVTFISFPMSFLSSSFAALYSPFSLASRLSRLALTLREWVGTDYFHLGESRDLNFSTEKHCLPIEILVLSFPSYIFSFVCLFHLFHHLFTNHSYLQLMIPLNPTSFRRFYKSSYHLIPPFS